jgi:hypothetical protein
MLHFLHHIVGVEVLSGVHGEELDTFDPLHCFQ